MKMPIASMPMVLMFLLSPTFSLNGHASSNDFVTRPFLYGQEQVSKFLRKSGVNVEVVEDIRRNNFGTELYIYLFESPTNRYSVIKVTTNGLIRLSAPGRGAVPGPNGDFVAWGDATGNNICFQSGQVLELPENSLFDVDPGGTYFVIGEKPSRTWLGRMQSPKSRTVVAEDMLAGEIFVSGDRIYVTGHTDTRNLLGETKPLTTCLIVKLDRGSFKIVERLTFEWAEGVAEVDPFSPRLLLWDMALVSHTAYSYDLMTKQRRKVGTVKGFEFFLVTNLLK